MEYRILIHSDKNDAEISTDTFESALEIFETVSRKTFWRKSPKFEIKIEGQTKSTPWITILKN